MFFLSLLIVLGCGSFLGLLILFIGLVTLLRDAPRLSEIKNEDEELLDSSLSVIVPAYNEESNIETCLFSLLTSESPCRNWNVLLVDDCSTDQTIERAVNLSEKLGVCGQRFNALSAGPRPESQRWVGKNWACSRAIDHIDSDWLLFIDADVCVDKYTLRRALLQAVVDEADLLSLAPRLKCSCLAEWMVQPIMASLLSLGFPIKATNEPNNQTAFAAGPFMLFRKSCYLEIGGHKAIASEVVEDLTLARKVKSLGYKLLFLMGLDSLELRMYKDFSTLWEGWSKNWFLGLDRNIPKAIGASLVVMLMFSLPWLLIPTGLLLARLLEGNNSSIIIILTFSILSIFLQFVLRLWTFREFKMPMNYWWLMGIGGIIIGAIGPISTWRTITGRGWTWKGRSLA